MAEQLVERDPGASKLKGGVLGWRLAAVRPAVLALGLIGLGAVIRLVHFLGGRSLWLDEVMIAFNIMHLPFRQLSGQLHFDQMAPLGWLLLEKWLFTLWPDFDYSLRLVALIAGLGALVCFWKLAQKALSPAAALVALGLFAICPPLIQYASMVKPYEVDVLFSVALTYCALSLLDGERPKPGRAALLGAVGLLAIAFSFPAVMVMAPIGLVLFVRAASRRDHRSLVLLAAVGVAWIAFFAAVYFGVYQRQAAVIDNMKTLYWGQTFAPLPPHSLGDLAWYPRSVVDALRWFLGAPGLVMVVMLAAGGLALLRERPWLLAILAGAIVTAILVSATKAYPFESRFVLYLAPHFLIVIAAGVGAIARQFRPYGLALAGLCLVIGAPAAAHTAKSSLADPPWPIEEIKPHLFRIAARSAPTDGVFVSVGGERAYLAYAPRYGLARDFLVGSSYRDSHTCVYLDVERLWRLGRPSWILLYHVQRGDIEPTAMFLTLLRDVGRIELVRQLPGSALYRFEPDARGTSISLPPPAKACFESRYERAFLEQIAARTGAGRPMQAELPAGAAAVTASAGTGASKPRS